MQETHAHTHSDDLQDSLPGFPPNVDLGRNDGEFSSALGLMSLEDPNALAELSNDVASFFTMNAMDTFSGNPDSTPMPGKLSTRGASLLTQYHQVDLTSTPTSGPNKPQSPGFRDEDSRDLKEDWKLYLCTPGVSDEPTFPDFSTTAASTGHSYRRTRVSSTVQTPSVERSGPLAANGASPVTRTTMHGNPDDLRSYEAAVLARRAPLLLNLVPKKARDASTSPGTPSRSSVVSASNGGAEPIRPSFKRLASRTLGPENAKRAMLGYDADDDSDVADGEERELSHQRNVEQQQPSQPGLQLGFSQASTLPPSSFGGLAGRRRRMSVPAMRLTVSTPHLLES